MTIQILICPECKATWKGALEKIPDLIPNDTFPFKRNVDGILICKQCKCLIKNHDDK